MSKMSSDSTSPVSDAAIQDDLPIESETNLFKIISASSAGTLIEWYDFYIFGALATTLAGHFFPEGPGATQLLSTLATFAIGFAVRPFGALFFGRLGDLIGRKYTFMITLLLMGGATFAIGILPGYNVLGWGAPIILIVLRLLQGLALGGEYGGAATYVAEHCPDGRRGYFTAWIQTTATLGLFVSLLVILACRNLMSKDDFDAWGWRIPFWVSLALVGFSYYIRRKMNESPLFQRMKSSGKGSKTPIHDSFGNWTNLRLVLIALFGATAGQGVVWYTGQFYAMTFTKAILAIDATQAEYIVSIALLAATPFFIVFGALSDRIGRKPIILAGCTLALICYYPIYGSMLAAADLKDPARYTLAENGIKPVGEPKIVVTKADSTKAIVGKTDTITRATHTYTDGTVNTVTTTVTALADAAKPPTTASKSSIKFKSLTDPHALTLIALIFVQVFFVTMVYGPIAAFLVELFPTRIRYTSMSLPYHIGNGMFGGMVVYLAPKLVDMTGNKFAGLWYPMAIAAITVVIGLFFIKENRNVKMHSHT